MSATTPETVVAKPSDFQPPSFAAARRTALLIGAVGIAVCLIGFLVDREQFFRSWLVGWVYWLAIALGCLAWSMVQHLTAGGWGLVMRRSLEAASRTLPWLALLFVPLIFGMESVFPWARPELQATDELIKAKVAYLNVPFFLGRTAIYFVLWTGLAYALSRASQVQDESNDQAPTIRMRMLSGPGVVVWVLLASFASWDYLMSLDPHWFSSLFGFYFVASTGLSALLFMTVVAWYLSRREPMQGVITTKHFHDYGKLTLALTMFWAYMTLSQFLITWSGNIPEFTIWYIHRNELGWKAYTVGLVIFHFFVPFLLLLSATLKKQPDRLVKVALFLLVMRFLDLYWQAAPTFHHELTFHYLDLAAPVAIGGLWVWIFLGELGKRPLLPVNDPFIPQVLGDHAGSTHGGSHD